MNDTYNSNLKPYARKLRKEMTEEERKLWYCFLKKLPIPIYRQKVIGKYIVDFYCAEQKIAIELDGSQHYEGDNPVKDEARDGYLKEQGISVIRYTNIELNQNYNGVCEDILKHLHLPV